MRFQSNIYQLLKISAVYFDKQKNFISKKNRRVTGKSLSEALIFASTNPQYDNLLFIDLRVQYIKILSSEHGENMRRTCCAHKLFFVLTFKTTYASNMFSPCSELGIFMFCTGNLLDNLLSYSGLVDAIIRASNKDLPVLEKVQTTFEKNSKAVFNSPILCL